MKSRIKVAALNTKQVKTLNLNRLRTIAVILISKSL